MPRAQGQVCVAAERPSTSFEQLWLRAYSMISAAGSLPDRIAVFAPSSCANFTDFRMRSRFCAGRRCSLGVSTYTAVHSMPI